MERGRNELLLLYEIRPRDRNIRVGILPEREKVVVGRSRFPRFAVHCPRFGETQMRESSDRGGWTEQEKKTLLRSMRKWREK